MPQYAIIVVNESTVSGTVCIFQTPPQLAGTLPVAWLARFVEPGPR